MSSPLAAGSSDDAMWQRLRFRFSELRDLLEGMRLETKEEAVGRPLKSERKKRDWADSAPRWFDPAIGQEVRAWHLIPYMDAIDQSLLRERMEFSLTLIPILEQMLSTKDLSVETLQTWGRFCSAMGAIELIYFSEPSVGHARSALAGGKASSTRDHQRWFAHYFLREYERGKRNQAEAAVERIINAIVDGDIAVPADYDVAWFERFIRLDVKRTDPSYARLIAAYQQDELSVGKMRGLVKEGAKGIPPVDFAFPEP